MLRKSIIIAIVTIAISLFATNTFAQLTGSVSGGLPGFSGSSNSGGPIARGGKINPGGGTSRATGVEDLYQSNGAFYGTLYAYNGSHFEIYTVNGDVIKTFANGCHTAAPSGGVAGLVCSFGHWNNSGMQLYSGWTYIYANGVVYIRWMYSYRSNFQWADADNGWYTFLPKA